MRMDCESNNPHEEPKPIFDSSAEDRAKERSGAQYKQLEALIVEVIRRCGVKGGVAPETYGAMCEGVREILRLAGPDAPLKEGK